MMNFFLDDQNLIQWIYALSLFCIMSVQKIILFLRRELHLLLTTGAATFETEFHFVKNFYPDFSKPKYHNTNAVKHRKFEFYTQGSL